MDIERRLQAHMDEFAERVEIPTDRDPKLAKRAGGPQRALTTVTAVLVVAMAGIGFWMLSDDSATTSLAAGDVDDVDEAQAEPDESEPGSGPALTIVDTTSADSPGFGRIASDGGVYYVLSTAPGKVEWSADMTDAEFEELHRQDTFYVLDDDNSWQVNSVEDRFVSDFAVDDGVLYVLSTGAPANDQASLGASSDFGSSWNWTTLDGLPTADAANLLIGDHGTLIFTSRRDRTDFDWVLKTAREANIPVVSESLQGFDATGFSYAPIDVTDRCRLQLLQFMPDAGSMFEYLADASPEEQDDIRLGIEETLGYFREETVGLGCEFDLQTLEDLIAVDLPETVRVSWDEIGVTIPESWKAALTLHSFEDGTLTEKTLPFDSGGGGWGWVADDRLEVVVTPAGQSNYEFGPEAFWSTGDGEAWERHSVDEMDDFGYYPFSYAEPRAGAHLFQVGWDAELETAREAEFRQAEQAVAAGDLSEEELYASYTYQPASLLQRSTDGGPWTDIDPSALGTGANLDGLALQDVQGSPLGVLAVYADLDFGEDGLVDDRGAVILATDDGESWTSFPVVGGDNVFHSNGESLLILSHDWQLQEEDSLSRTQALLVQQER